MSHSPLPQKKDEEITSLGDALANLHIVNSTLGGQSPYKLDTMEIVNNDQGRYYPLVIPVWLVIQDRIFQWDREGARYVEITMEKFLEETHQR